jgi:cation transport regulator ChaB
MAVSIDNKVFFPPSLSDIFPPDAQKLYIEAYKQSWADAHGASSGDLVREGVASRDGWAALRREFVDDPVTHKWHRIGEPAAAEATRPEKRAFLGTIKRLFKH